jgi:hypothetical protein
MTVSDLLKNPQQINNLIENNPKFVKSLSKKTLLKLIEKVDNAETIYKIAILKKLKLPSEKEQLLIPFDILAFDYLIQVKKTKWKEFEEKIALRNSLIALRYAQEILKDRFKEAEPLIIKSTHFKEYIKFLTNIKKLEEFKKDYPLLFVYDE